jgi:phosphatidylinositol 3-kinase
LYLSCQLHAHGQPLGLPERTCNMPGSRLRWNEWITFRAKYCDLSPDAWVALTLIGSAGPLAARTIGTARLPLFSEAQQLRTGVVTVLLDLSQGGDAVAEAAANGVGEATGEATSGAAGCAADVEEMARLEELAARHEEVTAQADRHLDWLNRPTFVHLEQRQLELSRRIERHLLSVQLPDFEYPVLFHEKVVSLPLLQPQKQASQTPRGGGGGSSSSLISAGSSGAGGAGGLRAVTEAGARASGWASGLHDSPVSVVLVSDLERPENNPALHKHHKLARSLLSAGFVKELKPDAEERRRLEALVQQPPTTRLREEERELLWKFRYSLTGNKRALVKFLLSVETNGNLLMDINLDIFQAVTSPDTSRHDFYAAWQKDFLDCTGRSIDGTVSLFTPS